MSSARFGLVMVALLRCKRDVPASPVDEPTAPATAAVVSSTAPNSTAPTADAVREPDAALLAPAPEITPGSKIRYEHGACFGRCPVYSFVLYLDGRVEFSGEHYVRVYGSAGHRVDAERTRKIFDRLAADGFWTWKSMYRSTVTDQSTKRIMVITGSLSKQIEEYVACVSAEHEGIVHAPPALCALMKDVVELADIADWITCKAPDGAPIACEDHLPPMPGAKRGR